MGTDRPSGGPVNSQDRHCVLGFGVVEEFLICVNQSSATNEQHKGDNLQR